MKRTTCILGAISLLGALSLWGLAGCDDDPNYDCDTRADCANHGECASGVCDCDPGFVGIHCTSCDTLGGYVADGADGCVPDSCEDLDGDGFGDVAIGEFCAEIAKAGTIIWNGPMGVFEKECFAKGTREVGKAVAANQGVSIVGGGDSVTAVKKFGLEAEMTFMSTGGGASLELLEGKPLPGVVALDEA